MNYEQIINRLKTLENPKNVEGMARYGINPENNLGINVTTLRGIAKEIGKDHELALKLWESGIHDARMLAAHVEDPKQVTEKQMDEWASDFNSWDVCDNACGHLFDKTPFAYSKAIEWSKRKEEFVKRASFAIMAWSAVHDKKSDNKRFEEYLKIIKRESTDERNYVRKSVNWALRNIGKRNQSLNKKAIKTAEEIKKIDSKAARWIANDAIRELTSDKIQQSLKKKS
jgi:3-methyladenine DNA glycosylase AlkD